MWPNESIGEYLPEGDAKGVDVTLGRVGPTEKGLRGRPAKGHAIDVVGRVSGHQGGNVGYLDLKSGGVDDAVSGG